MVEVQTCLCFSSYFQPYFCLTKLHLCPLPSIQYRLFTLPVVNFDGWTTKHLLVLL